MKYYLDNRTYEFETEVINSSPEGKEFYITLDETYFYPEGGGQPGDIGFINQSKVLDTQKIDGNIIHICDCDPGTGHTRCTIDREYRDHYMKQHTAQHLISAVLKHELDIDTLSVHLGNPEFTIEVNRDTISDQEIKQLENRAFELITQGKEVIYHETDDEGLKNFKIRRESKYTGYIRVVEIDGYDAVPCGGVHLTNLSELGLVKISGYEKIRGNIRLTLLSGIDALKDYQQKNQITRELNRELSSQDSNLLESFNVLQEQISNLKVDKKNLIQLLQNRIIDSYTQEKPELLIFENYPMELLKKVVAKLCGEIDQSLLIINKTDKLLWMLINSKDKNLDLKTFRSDILPLINGKGGGKPELWQGSGDLEGEISFISGYKTLLVSPV